MIDDDLIAARVIARERVACDVISLRLVSDAPDLPLPAFEAGAHIDLHLRDGLTRKYSLCNDPFERGVYEIAIKREPASRGGSAHMHDAVRVGDVLRIGAPLNYFPLAPDGSPAVLLAAGIGVTPLLAMAHSLIRAGRPLALHYFVRSDDAAAYRPTLASRLADVATVHTGLTPDATGDAIAAIVGAMDARAHLYFCGPAPFMAAVDAIARPALGDVRLHHEYFSAPIAGEAAGAGDAGGEAGAFRIELARSQRVLLVPPGQSITDVLFDHDIPIATSCEAGICGACRTAVLAGTPDHRDAFLSAAEKGRNDCMMPCVSRCRGERLVLDL
ncbi:PDR/VanB family oxidoreductase [Burkholderia oklahomensis]|uniref:2Fe-2S iron-sulfur cluster binding domain protein n=1 Tax=Burkholderia oklahomensis TaxID=342113 RepID=A0AAI8BBW4_9BURK|nr:PDR/VanB family oxidoreductase [Burkholderia oklahomensis]AIO69978.1 2Fe-2S iron-sulfur cluster binding domain protein [Burkholderia oklahomensis]AOI40609.1 ferredoxin [Burkholderia oklahomensis EO147]KUY51620.1 ferredoxin [Burkholderia oklahomensis EO147]QPS40009.1 oxidoreductase [Burkholderia oklahomensis]